MSEVSGARTVLVSGANRGIGLEIVRQLAQDGCRVIAVCRSGNEALSELDVEIIEGIDVSSARDVSRLAQKVAGRTLDWVVNNAGVLELDSLEALDFEAIERQFRVNTLGPLRVTAALLGNMKAGSRAFVITSAMGSIGDNTSGGYYGYRISKAAVNMAFKSLSVDLRKEGIGAYMLHPGYVVTDMTRHQGDVSAEQSVRGLIARMSELNLEQTGTFRHARGHDLAW